MYLHDQNYCKRTRLSSEAVALSDTQQLVCAAYFIATAVKNGTKLCYLAGSGDDCTLSLLYTLQQLARTSTSNAFAATHA
jgi:hypothetical protein